MLADYHVHTSFSDDSQCPMERAVQRAIKLGLDEICFTEHVDYGVKTDTNCHYPAYMAELQRCRETYGGRVTIKQGIEFGIQRHTVDEFKRDFDAYEWDFVLMSNHQVNDQEVWANDFQRGRTVREYTTMYYEETLAVIESYDDYSVLAHMDFINRFDSGPRLLYSEMEPLFTKILQRAIGRGKGLEVNTACFRYNLNDLTPSVDILKLYHKLGGRVLTLGSDAHVAGHIAWEFDNARRQLRELGFTEFCTFEKMQPAFHPL